MEAPSIEEMAPGSVSQATAAADPSCPPFPLLELEEDGGHVHEHEQEVPRGGELELPTVDLEAPGDALAEACRELGMFRLANHGVPASLSARLFALARGALAGASFHDKRALPGYFWGTPAVSLRVRDVNWLEGFHVALGSQGQQQPAPPPPLGDLLDLARAEYGAHMARVARTLFDALAPALGLGAGQAAAYLAERDGFLRVYRYPRCPEPGRLGMEAHTDSSVLSVINQEDDAAVGGGLQVLHGGAWRDVAPAGDGTLLVNLGDMARAISGDAYRSVRHRVAASQAAERLSLCYFAFPRDGAVIISGGGRYRPFTYAEFREQVQADIKATGSKVGLERFLMRPSRPR